jgi:hypothetical protein
MILFSSLLVLSLLITVGVGSRIMLTNDYKISSNLRLSTDAFYLAEAGIEWSKREISVTSSHPPILTERAQSLSSGAFSVAFPSSTADTPLSAKIVVRSTGTVGTSTHQLQAQLTKTYDLADGAAGLRGDASRVGFSGNSFLISGADHDPATAAPSPEPDLARPLPFPVTHCAMPSWRNWTRASGPYRRGWERPCHY